MKLSSLVVAVATLVALPCRADPSLAGAILVTASHGQPFCGDQGELQAMLRASIAGSSTSILTFPSCLVVPDNTKVEVIQDLSPRTRAMHVVRARVYFLTGPRDAFTYTAGLHAPIPGLGVRVPAPLPYFQ